MYNFKDMEQGQFEDMVCLINSIRLHIQEWGIESFDDLIDNYTGQIFAITDKEMTTEEEDMKMINLKVEYEMIFNNPTFFGNLFK